MLQEFDKRYGVGWQCVVGANFGCFFTHTSGTFIYFSLERLSFLLFKAAAAAAIAADLNQYRLTPLLPSPREPRST